MSKLFLIGVSLSVALAAGGGGVRAGQGGAAVTTAAVRVAPPPPVWDDAERLAELAARRARVAEGIGQKSVLVLFSAEPRVYAGDVNYEFRQENNLFYLTHLNQAGSRLVLMPGHASHREVLFLPRRNPASELWSGRMYSPEEARALSGVAEIWEAREFEPFVNALLAGKPYRPKPEAVLLSASAAAGAGSPAAAPSTDAAQPATAASGGVAGGAGQTGYESIFAAAARKEASLYLLLPNDDAGGEFRQEREFAARFAGAAGGFAFKNAWHVFTRLREVKSPAEVRLIQHAVDITIEALGRAMLAAGEARYEYEVEAEIDYTFRRRGADDRGYPSIVGCGANATTLHYEESRGPCRPGDLLLMDVGAEYAHYSADLTRTVPVSGRFTPAQAEIYNAVLAAQEAALRAARPGATLGDVHNAAADSLRESLHRLGLITERRSQQYGLWFMHGTSHWLGMNVHDVGSLVRKLEPGVVFTVEPGLYVRPDALERLPQTPENQKFIEAVRPAFERYKGIGVRIEDDIVITQDGHRNLSAALPRTLAEVEAAMARAPGR